MSRDVVFDELASDQIETGFDTNTKEDDRLRLTKEESPLSTRLSRPQEPLSNQITSPPSPKSDKGKAKMPEFEDSDGIVSEHSLGSEYGGLDVPIMRTP